MSKPAALGGAREVGGESGRAMQPVSSSRHPVRFLITNAVPLNGGDEALLRALAGSLARRWPESRITVLCKAAETVRTLLPDMTLLPDLEFTDPQGKKREAARKHKAGGGPVGALAQKLGLQTQLEFLASSPARREVLRAYQEADVVLSAPGGFLSDHYSLEPRMRGFELALRLGKPVVLCAQSVGPFWKPESRKRVGEVLSRLTALCVRDTASVVCLQDCGVAEGRIHETADAAFLWRGLAPELFREHSGPPRLLALCFRAWPPGGRGEIGKLVEKAVAFCRHLLAAGPYQLRFLSTCQGMQGYVDDSELARRIVGSLSAQEEERCEIEARRLSTRELIHAYGECDAYLGMRLHGALLSLLGGTPAMGLGYEAKTEQIFRQLDLSEYQVEFRAPVEEWIAAADRLLRDHTTLHTQLAQELDRQYLRAEQMLEVIAEIVAGQVVRG